MQWYERQIILPISKLQLIKQSLVLYKQELEKEIEKAKEEHRYHELDSEWEYVKELLGEIEEWME